MVIRSHQSATSGERALWQEVLLRAITDARLEHDSWPIPKSAHEVTADARRYLTTPSKDLAMVCAMAGIEMEAMLERMQRQVSAVPAIDHVPADATPKAPRVRNRPISHDDRSLTLPQWATVTGIPESVIRSRINHGWTLADALTIPKRLRA